MTDCFQILKILPTATQTEIKAKWRELCRIHHPDRGGNAVEFDLCRKAYLEAMDRASRPSKCEHCSGSGRKIIQRGFFAVKIRCGACQGLGRTPRTTN